MRGGDLRHYSRIGVFENARRLEFLVRYRNDVVEYFNHVQPRPFGDPPSEDDVALSARRRINLETDDACDVIHAAGISTTMTYTPPPLIGGYIRNVELVHNVFNGYHFEMSPQSLIDMIDRARGVYERNHRHARIRTLNPFFYLGLVLDAVASSPFLLATRVGLPGKRLEDSILGVLVRVLVYMAGVAASAIAILTFLGYGDEARAFVTQWLGI
jgi:hypothetical protein